MLRGDDFGVTHAGNMGMKAAIEAGMLKSCSVIVNGAWIAETVAILKQHPEIEVGLHIALTSEWDTLRWPPIARDVRSLVAPDGNLWRGGVTWISPYQKQNRPPLFANLDVNPTDMEKEVRAQVKRAQDLGLRIDYIDCHNWTACAGAGRPILKRIAQELGVPIPEPEAGFMDMADTKAEDARRKAVDDYEIYRKALLQDIAAMQPGKVYRTVLHPWPDTDEVRFMDTVRGVEEAKIRAHELRLATDPLIKAAVRKKRLSLLGPAAIERKRSSVPATPTSMNAPLSGRPVPAGP